MAKLSIKQDVSGRAAIERKLARLLGSRFSEQIDKLLDLMGDPPDPNKVPLTFWEAFDTDTRNVLSPIMVEIYQKQIDKLLTEISFGVDWGLVNQWAIDWANHYTFELVRGITERTRSALARAIEIYQRDGLSKDQLADMIEPLFGPIRAEMIAITETTRASVQGELAAVNYIETNNPNIRMIGTWQTANDELVCPICGPNHGKVQGDGWNDPPPAHPRCRCWVNYEMTVVEK